MIRPNAVANRHPVTREETEFSTAASCLKADTGMANIIVTCRERIALPPNAELDVQLLALCREVSTKTRIASRRFVMEKVPMTVELNFDPKLIVDATACIVTATVWSDHQKLFCTQPPHALFGDAEPGVANIFLGMIAENPVADAVPRKVTSVEWAVTEVVGTLWPHVDPATLMIKDEANVSAFVGRNRFHGDKDAC